MSLLVGCIHPFSRGNLHISSIDISVPPVIEPNFLSNEVDKEILKAGARFTLKNYETAPLKEWVVEVLMPKLKGSDIKDVDDDKVLEDTIHSNFETIYHTVGTCSMMPLQEGGVVDGRLRVYGVKGLRVVDLSVLPLVVSCNTQTMVYAIGEKVRIILRAVDSELIIRRRPTSSRRINTVSRVI
jgi:choline dehydrogenase-like flavoprotein